VSTLVVFGCVAGLIAVIGYLNYRSSY
jgi:hypothetical protein